MSTQLRKGDLGYAALCGGREVLPDEFVDDRPYFGLHREAGYVWGTFRDDHGDVHSLMRRMPPPQSSAAGGGSTKSLGDRLLVLSTMDDAVVLDLRKEARYAAPSRAIEGRMDGESALFTTSPAAGAYMALRLGSERVSYLEEGVVQVEGSRACSGLQWYVPGRDAALYYTTQTWMVEGELLGRPVRGFLFYEEAYMPPGGRLYVTYDPLTEAPHITWYSWATRWEDGITEIGHFIYGHQNLAVAVTADSEGNVRGFRSMDCRVTRNADGYWHDRIDYDLDGEQWEMLGDERLRMAGLGPIPNPQQEGTVRRKGETRAPEVWMAWGESVPGNGDQRRHSA
jgi:hypothetical protein